MNILVELVKKASGNIEVGDAIKKEIYSFSWKQPADQEKIVKFEKENGVCLPDYYKEFLACADGGIIYKSLYEDDGYELLGIDSVEEYTKELVRNGYDIPEGCFCFLKCLFSDDVVLFNLKKQTDFLLDGDVGYPVNMWEYLKSNLNVFFARLIQSNGAMYWRWR